MLVNINKYTHFTQANALVGQWLRHVLYRREVPHSSPLTSIDVILDVALQPLGNVKIVLAGSGKIWGPTMKLLGNFSKNDYWEKVNRTDLRNFGLFLSTTSF